MDGIQNLEFKPLLPAHSDAVHDVVMTAIDMAEENGFTPLGRAAFERYVSAVAQRAGMGYHHELVYVSGELAGMIETKDAHITMLYVHPSHAGKGLGSRLVLRAASRCGSDSCAKTASSKNMTVHATDGSVNFYERLGFTRNGSRKESGGIFSTPMKLSMKEMNRSLSTKLHSKAVEFFVFTGTGNSLIAAQTAADALRQRGVSASLRSMDKPCPQALDEDTAVGLAFPVACFSTYPAVWRFISSMPAGEGREVFMLATCGGAGMGMEGPMRAVLSQKGYKPVAAKILVMPGNYNNKIMQDEKNAARADARKLRSGKALSDARSFVHDMLKGGVSWGGGIPLLSSLMYRLGQTRWPWSKFYKMFPITADTDKCVRCRRCANDCPAGAITADSENFPVVDASLCESCQRCVGFCPKGALGVPGKPAEPYRALTYERFKNAFDK